MENLLGILVSVLAVILLIYYVQKKIRLWLLPRISSEAKALHRTLVELGIPAELELFDGHKTVDIAVPAAKIHIEVDGSHHNTSSRQALADLKRTYFSLQQGIYTIRIPNSLVRHHLPETATVISKIVQLHKAKTKQYK